MYQSESASHCSQEGSSVTVDHSDVTDRDPDPDPDPGCDADSDSELPKKKRAKPKRYCSFSSAWKTAEFLVNIGCGNEKKLSGSVLRGKDGDSSAYCILCKVEFSVRHGGANDVRKHFSSTKHISSVTASSTSRPLSS